MHYVFISPSLPNSRGKGYQKLLHQRLALLPAGSDITLIVCRNLQEKNYQDFDLNKDYPKLHIHLIYPKYSFLDAFMLIPRFLLGYPIQVLMHQRQSLNILLKEIWRQDSGAHVYCMLSRTFHKNIHLFECSLLDFVDSMQLNFERKAGIEKNIIKKNIYRLEARRMKRWDQIACNNVQEAIVVSELDSDYIGNNKIEIIPIGVDQYNTKPTKLKNRNGNIAFSGNMNYPPNIEAVKHFVANCYPQLRERNKNVEFHIVGRGLPIKVKDQLSKVEGVVVIGEVDDMQLVLSDYPISVAPMRSGSGMQFKILESISVGTIVVASKLAARAFNSYEFGTLYVAETDQSFVEIINELFRDIGSLDVAVEKSKVSLQSAYGWDKTARQLTDLVWFSKIRKSI
jgi:glycosyltransferase involved in cell wall biosynthesis